MENKFLSISVAVQVEKGSDIHLNLQELAMANNSTIEKELEWLVMLGLNHHLRRNIERMKRECGVFD